MRKISLLEVVLLLYLFCLVFFGGLKSTFQIGNMVLPFDSILSSITIFLVLIIAVILGKRDFFEKKSPWLLFCLFCFILLYASVTVFSKDSIFGVEYKIPPLILSFLAMCVPFIFSFFLSKDKDKQKQIVFLVALIITSSTFCYASWSVFKLGVGRLQTPLGGAAVIHVALLLTLSVYVANIKQNYYKLISVVLTFLTMGLIILTGSRAGLITLLLFVILSLIDFKKPLKSMGLSLLFLIFFLVLFQILPTDRFKSFESNARDENFETSLNIIKDSTMGIIFGQGYGEIWPWYAYENYALNSQGLISTSFGYVLTNPHSIFLGVLVELGLIGMVSLILIFLIIIKEMIKAYKRDNILLKTIFLGIICTLPAFFLDLYLFKNYAIAVLWWFFVFFSLRTSQN